jgi:hypothetical protein
MEDQALKVGMTVWYWPAGPMAYDSPQESIVTHILDDAHVNLITFTELGSVYTNKMVKLLAPDDIPAQGAGFATRTAHAPS